MITYTNCQECGRPHTNNQQCPAVLALREKLAKLKPQEVTHLTGGEGFDPVSKPKHYNAHPSGIECIQITEHLNFCLGNAMKYIWRAGLKSEDPVQDLEKAVWYIQREIWRLKKEKATKNEAP
jgi:hypothetical protein